MPVHLDGPPPIAVEATGSKAGVKLRIGRRTRDQPNPHSLARRRAKIKLKIKNEKLKNQKIKKQCQSQELKSGARSQESGVRSQKLRSPAPWSDFR